jgi:predicted HD phosphohydrolase
MHKMEQGPLAGYMPYTRRTSGVLHALGQLQPATLAVMHGSSYEGPAAGLLHDLAAAIEESIDRS